MFKIGKYIFKNPYILAPMAGVSQMPFRRLALKLGASLAPTELVSAKGLFFESIRTKSYLIHDNEIERPFCVQLFGGEEEPMAIAAEKAMAMGADIIDINMGCPVKKVTKINAGSALLCDHARASRIVSAMLKRTGYKIPITAKIRSGWNHENLNYVEVAEALQDAGASAIAIHARTRAQGYSGKADWSHIALLKSKLHIPVFGNGDVMDHVDAQRMLKMTNCDAVMVGRASLGNPWIFKELMDGKKPAVSHGERLSLIRQHLMDHMALNRQIFELEGRRDEKFFDMMAIRSFRNHLIWYSKGLSQGARFRQAIMAADSLSKTHDLMEEFFSQASMSIQEHVCDDGIDYRQAFG